MNPEQLLQHFDRISEAPDAIPRLRRFILDLAVRGKLVEQDPNDEPVVCLLAINDRERQDKSKLDHRADLEQQELLAEEHRWAVPSSWAWRGLADIVLFIDYRGKTPTKTAAGVRLITAKNVKQGYINLSPDEFLAEPDYQKWMTRGVPKIGDVLFTTEAPMGNAAVVRLSDKFALAQRVICFHPYTQLNSDFLVLQLLAQPFQFILDKTATGLTAKGIKAAKLKRLPIAIPPLAEQNRIVAKVDELMALCDQLQAAQTEREQSRDRLVAASLHSLNPPADDEAANAPETQREQARFLFNHLPRLTTRPAHIKQLRQTILNLAVRGKLVAQDPNDEPVSITLEKSRAQNFKRWNEDLLNRGIDGSKKCPSRYKELTEPNTKVLFALPMLWNWVCWESILAFGEGTFKRGPFGSALTKSIFVSSGYKVYEQYCPINDDCSFARYYITPEKFKELEGFAVKAGDFLISCSGVTLGRITQVPNDYEEGVINQALLRVRTDKTLVDDAFFKMLFRSPYFQTQIFSNSMGMAIPNVKGVAELKAIPLPLPPLAEQHRIVAKVDELMALCDQLETQLADTANDSRRLLEAVLHDALLPADVAA